MAKHDEIMYVVKMAEVLGVPPEEVGRSLRNKPYSETRRGHYLADIGQLFRLLPQPPASLLDLGCGPGWTSRMLAIAGYDVLGVDICPDMIQLASENATLLPNLRFAVWDYELPLNFGDFHAALIYDALHHAADEAAVIRTAYNALRPGGLFLTIEPGTGHAASEGSRQAIARFNTTEKDMPYSHQRTLMLQCGFETVRQYIRVGELPLESLDTLSGIARQQEHFAALLSQTLEHGLTSVVVAHKAP